MGSVPDDVERSAILIFPWQPTYGVESWSMHVRMAWEGPLKWEADWVGSH